MAGVNARQLSLLRTEAHSRCETVRPQAIVKQAGLGLSNCAVEGRKNPREGLDFFLRQKNWLPVHTERPPIKKHPSLRDPHEEFLGVEGAAAEGLFPCLSGVHVVD